MSQIDVVGGVYGEICAFPVWDQIFGSAGRAAVALSGHVDQIRLHSAIADDVLETAQLNFGAFGVEICAHKNETFVTFDYLHCLSVPRIIPATHNIPQQKYFEVSGELVVSFGMMECTPRIKAIRCIYDPQSPIEPKTFKSTGSTAEQLVVIANNGEIELLTGKVGDESASALLTLEDAALVIVKNGLSGASVYDAGGLVGKVPAYRTETFSQLVQEIYLSRHLPMHGELIICYLLRLQNTPLRQ